MQETKLSSRTLRLAYCAIKQQLALGDMKQLWDNWPQQRDELAQAESDLRDALVAASLANEVERRGGPKKRN